MPTVHILDYVAGNVRSLANAIEKVGYTVQWIKTPEDVQYAEVRDRADHSSESQDRECMLQIRATADEIISRN